MKELEDIQKRIEVLQAAGNMTAFKEVKKLAEQILNENEGLRTFCMGMGTWGFWDTDGDLVYNMAEYPWSDEKKVTRLAEVLGKYDEYFSISGEPVRMDKIREPGGGFKLKTVYDWEVGYDG